MSDSVRKIVLLVEDNHDHAELIRRSFDNAREDYQVDAVCSLASFKEYLDRTAPALIICDYLLPDGTGLDILRMVDGAKKVPFILLTSHGDETVAVEAMKSGATDYIVKSDSSLHALPDVCRAVLREYDEKKDKERSEDSRHKAHALIEALLASSPAGILVYEGSSGKCILANDAIAGITGGMIETPCQQNFREINFWHESGLDRMAEAVLNDGVTRQKETKFTTTEGKVVPFECLLSRFFSDGNPHLLFIAMDISEKKRLEEKNRHIEEQMLHVQKLESLGVLAGGIAHDFNNILMAVLGNADLALMRLAPESPARENLLQIEQASRRAADLARQMLAYSGKGRFVIETLNITAIVKEMMHMLEVSISKKAVLRYNFPPNLPLVDADATQLRQIIMNLVINASEAIGDQSGVIAISTGAMDCDRAYLAETWIDDGLPEGLYVYVEIADTGCGIAREIIPKIFDPFFTTKFTGRGLGMAAVLGIVRGHKGAIKVYSEIGKGALFKFLLPASKRAGSLEGVSAQTWESWKGSGTILLVDDEETIRAVGKDMLQEMGFTVLSAADGREALEIFRLHCRDIVCVILDLTMPHIDGEQAFREFRRVNPGVRVLMSSGYNEQEINQKFVGKGIAGFLQKPYTMMEFSRKLREILDSERAGVVKEAVEE